MRVDYHIHTNYSDDCEYPMEEVVKDAVSMGVEDQEIWCKEFQKGKTWKEYNERYYREMLALVQKYKNYSVLGHIDFITRYDDNGIYLFEKVKSLIEEVLKTVIADGKGIEVNTSCYRYGLNDLTPSKQILNLYYGSPFFINCKNETTCLLGNIL